MGISGQGCGYVWDGFWCMDFEGNLGIFFLLYVCL